MYSQWLARIGYAEMHVRIYFFKKNLRILGHLITYLFIVTSFWESGSGGGRQTLTNISGKVEMEWTGNKKLTSGKCRIIWLMFLQVRVSLLKWTMHLNCQTVKTSTTYSYLLLSPRVTPCGAVPWQQRNLQELSGVGQVKSSCKHLQLNFWDTKGGMKQQLQKQEVP